MCDWIDLPDDDYVAVLGYETPLTVEINSLIKKYNIISKDQVATLPSRIRKLDQITAFIDHWLAYLLSPCDKPKHLNWLSEIALKKRNYLSKLQEIYENGKHNSQERDLCTTEELVNPKFQAVFLNNFHCFSLKMKEYWGDFWFEALDPCHRRLTPFLEQWRALQKQNPNIPHFFLWLETQHLPKYVPTVNYLQGSLLEEKRIIIKNGVFMHKNREDWIPVHFDDPKKRYLFAIDLKGDLFGAEETEGISHSSFTCGKPVLGAGLFHISRGQLISLALESGHYLPSVEIGFQMIKIWEGKGLRFPQLLKLAFFYDRNKYVADLTPDEFANFTTFHHVLQNAIGLKKEGVCA